MFSFLYDTVLDGERESIIVFNLAFYHGFANRKDADPTFFFFDKEAPVKPVKGRVYFHSTEAAFLCKLFHLDPRFVSYQVIDKPVGVLFFHLYTFPFPAIIVCYLGVTAGTLFARTVPYGNMDAEKPGFPELVRVADCLLEEAGEDDDALARRLEVLPGQVREELLVSDLLNAWQAFYFYFRIFPDDLAKERLELEPASSLIDGVLLDEINIAERIFRVRNGTPEILVTDGKTVLKTFSGSTALDDSLSYAESLS